MVKVVIGTNVCSFEEMIEEYSRVCEENEKLKSLIEEKNKEIAGDKNFAKECSEFSNKCIELQHINHELKARISELESELAVKEDLLKISSGIKNIGEKIEKFEQIHENYEEEPLPFYCDEYEDVLLEELEELRDRHQQDCITINQLQTTIDTLVDRYAKLREIKGM